MSDEAHAEPTRTTQRVSVGETQTERLGAAIGRVLQGGDVVALEGPLGAGKTRLVRGIAAGMGLDPRDVSSPTYVLVQEYGPSPAGLTLAHVDAYRLDDAASLDGIGGDEFLGEADVVTIVEWASRVADGLPASTAWIDIAVEAPRDASDDAGPGNRRSLRVREGGEGSGTVARVRDAVRSG